MLLQIVNVETGETLSPNQLGEICFKRPALFGGYIEKNHLKITMTKDTTKAETLLAMMRKVSYSSLIE